jgi:predicted enzyme related to lactoylglutathione lyase
MADFNYLLLAVKDPRKSAALYEQLFGVAPVENSPTFVLYVLKTGLKVGLWSAGDMRPAPRPAGGVELSFSLPDEKAVRETYAAWTKLGLAVVQEPTHLDFGFTFVVADPDGHRLRPFVLADNPR